jgi:hypothetical protein
MQKRNIFGYIDKKNLPVHLTQFFLNAILCQLSIAGFAQFIQNEKYVMRSDEAYSENFV